MKKTYIIISIVLVLLAALSSAQQTAQEIRGKVEILQYGDPANPGVAEYLYYLNTGNARYKIESNGQLPPLMPGASVTLRGLINGNILFVDSAAENSAEILSQPAKFENLQVAEESASKIKFTWLYFTFPVFILLGFFLYHEVERKKGHSDIAGQKRQHLLSGLRNYALSNMKKGYKKEQIKNALIKNNYDEKDVDEAFKGL